MDDVTVSIKPATAADVLPLQQISIGTFTDTYAIYNTPENMQLFIDTYYNTQRLLDELADAAQQYYLTYLGEELVGYIKLRTTENPPELAGKKHIEVERIYVLPGFKGRRIGKYMIDHAITIARQNQYEVVWLGVWDQNTNAQAFYTKQGFTVFGEHGFVLGEEHQRDWLMKKELM